MSEKDAQSYAGLRKTDEGTVEVLIEREKRVQTLDGNQGSKTEQEVVAEIPAEWEFISPLVSELVDEFGPDPRGREKSVTQRMDEAYDR